MITPLLMNNKFKAQTNILSITKYDISNVEGDILQDHLAKANQYLMLYQHPVMFFGTMTLHVLMTLLPPTLHKYNL
jgi:hypothetical protein